MKYPSIKDKSTIPDFFPRNHEISYYDRIYLRNVANRMDYELFVKQEYNDAGEQLYSILTLAMAFRELLIDRGHNYMG